MSNFLVASNVADLHAEPNNSSETVTQAILGASVTVEREEGAFCYAQTEDRYHGWIAKTRLAEAWDDTDYLKTSIATLFAEVFSLPDDKSELITKLVVSTRIAVAHRPEVGDYVPIILPDQRVGYVHQVSLNITHQGGGGRAELVDPRERRALDVGELKKRVLAAVGRQAVDVGKRLIGTPYLWGGCTPFGIDCSGFVQLAYKLSGVQLLRDADIQFQDKRFVKIEEGRGLGGGEFTAGDLLVFSNRDDRAITHIGMATGDGRFIHSSGARGVGINPCDDPAYNKTYLGAARISPDADLAVEAA